LGVSEVNKIWKNAGRFFSMVIARPHKQVRPGGSDLEQEA